MNDDNLKDCAMEFPAPGGLAQGPTSAAGQTSIGHKSTRRLGNKDRSHGATCNLPMTVRDAAKFLGVSAQTVYLWVERKQIPHFRVMGRNIRFLRSDLKPFRAQFKKEVENGTTT
jgi:excisionase family DNA binding protein